MIASLARRIFKSQGRRRLTRYQRIADQILTRADDDARLTPGDLLTRMQQLRAAAKAGKPLDELTIPCFALVREAARRTLGQQHVRAQLIGGLALRDGAICEMKTGEGKTLAATLASVLFALRGQGVHIAAPNDYLSARDADWMQPIYTALGISVGLITPSADDDSRRGAYACDITYGIASEFAFDYLRDNMRSSAAATVQRGHAFTIIDEADAVLIDEASMPLALFGPLGDHSAYYTCIDNVIAALPQSAAECELAKRRVSLTSTGYTQTEQSLRDAGVLNAGISLHDVEAVSILHHVMQALRAHRLLARDRDYIVQDNHIVIIDRHTGRPMPGRRYDEGLHQALEAKEALEIGEETRTLASIRFQTFFRLYSTLAGMTGTANSDVAEYREIYGLDVVCVPTHRPIIRRDENHLHTTHAAKMDAVLTAIDDAHAQKRPVLVGAPSIERSELIAASLEARGWVRTNESTDNGASLCNSRTFRLLNAKHRAEEAHIIAGAGRPGAVTIATAMAGRGTDIRLAPESVSAGGLLVIGTEHHTLARMDDQLRGRAGRQGDDGAAVFHSSLEDATLRGVTARPGAIVAAMQRQNANRDQAQRLATLRFEDVVQRQRTTMHSFRNEIRDSAMPLTLVRRFRQETIDDIVSRYASHASWDRDGLDSAIRAILTLAITLPENYSANDIKALRENILEVADDWMNRKVNAIGASRLAGVMHTIMLALIDQLWAEHTEKLNHLSRMVGDRRLPVHRLATEYRIEAFALFELMIRDFRHEVTTHAMRVGIS